MRTQSLLLVLSVALVLLAGCGQRTSRNETLASESSRATLAPPPALIVQVVDLELVPIKGVNVTVETANKTTLTRFDGKAVGTSHNVPRSKPREKARSNYR